jgi:hypothetical protein
LQLYKPLLCLFLSLENKISKNSHYAIIEYGNGECDNLAMLAIDGGTAKPIILGN